MTVSPKGIALIKSLEGCRLKAYLDTAGVPTIGYGETLNVKMGMTITQEQAERMFAARIKDFATGVAALLKVPVNQNQFDALVSFTYNEGLHRLRGSTLLKLLNAGDPIRAAAEFPKWDKDTDPKTKALKVNPGLVKRRAAEKALFLTPVVVR